MAQLGRPLARLDIGGLSDRGRQRRRNEDFWGRAEDSAAASSAHIGELGRLYLVSDGVGGNEDGDIASREAVEQVMARFYNAPYSANLAGQHRLERAIVESSRELAAQIDNFQNNMAATLVAALLDGDRLIVANVGDSRAYLIRASGQIEQLSVDHVENGNQLTQAMGDRRLDIAVRELPLARDDVVVLCTDGLHDLVRPNEISRIVRRSPARIAARQLIRLANRRAGHDNITVVIIRNGAPPRPIGLYLRIAAGVAAAAGVMLLLGTLNTLAPVQAREANQYLGISRSSAAQLDPTATLSVLELKATATTVYIKAEATRGIILPTLTPLPAASAPDTEQPRVPAVPSDQSRVRVKPDPGADTRPAHEPTVGGERAIASTMTPTAMAHPKPTPSDPPHSEPGVGAPTAVGAPVPSDSTIAIPTRVVELPVPAVQLPAPGPSTAPILPTSDPQPSQPSGPTPAPGRAGRPTPVSHTSTPTVPMSTPVPTSAPPTSTSTAPPISTTVPTVPPAATATEAATSTTEPIATLQPTSTRVPPTSTPRPTSTPAPRPTEEEPTAPPTVTEGPTDVAEQE